MDHDNYIRQDNETEQDFINRVCDDKDLIGTWENVAKILNSLLGHNYTESKYRKNYKKFKKKIKNAATAVSSGNSVDIYKNNDIVTGKLTNSSFSDPESVKNSQDYLQKLIEQEEKLKKERIKLQTLNIERSRIDRIETRRELFYEQIRDACTALSLPDFHPLQTKISEDGDIEYLVCLADIHYGAEFSSINNEYSPKIAHERMEFLFTRLAAFINVHHIRKLSIVGLGDFIQGLLRLSDLKINDTSVVKAVVDVSRLVASLLNQLSQLVEIDYYHTPTANHTQLRLLGANANELCDEDVEYIIGNYIYDLCRNNDRIKVNLSASSLGFIKIPIFNYDIYAMHGHKVKDVNNAIRNLDTLIDENVDYLIVGHMHNGQEIVSSESTAYDKEVLVCPSFIGSDPFSDSLFKGGKAAVKIFGFDEIEGHVESYKIILN